MVAGMLKGNKNKISITVVTLVFALLVSFAPFSGGSSAFNVYADRAYTKETIEKRTMLYPGGMAFGVQMKTDGALVVGFSEVETDNGSVSPAEDAGFMVRDVIRSVNEKPVRESIDVTRAIENSDGREIIFDVLRAEKDVKIKLSPVMSQSDGKYKVGMWLRDSTAGIGTVTYINPEDNSFGGLGHGICDADTGVLMPMRVGRVSRVTVSSVKKGKSGAPGELKGWFHSGTVGELYKNTEKGVFGRLDREYENNKSTLLPTARLSEIETGDATIICTVDGNTPCEYKIKIVSVDEKSPTKNFSIELVDQALISITGGIVQGMSGSPIIQNGKLVGAVTHVLVNDPTTGYGIFIENMLNAAQMPMAKAS